MPHVFKLRIAAQPCGKFFAPGCRDFVNDASGAAFGGSTARSQQLLFLQPFQRWIDLAQFGGPEMPDSVVQDVLQIVSAGGRAEQAQQNMFETHTCDYITYYINVNCFSPETCTRRYPRVAGTERRLSGSTEPHAFRVRGSSRSGRCIPRELLVQRRMSWARTKFSATGHLDKRTNV